MEEEKKSGKGGIVVFVRLFVLALGAAGFFAYNYFSGAGCSKCNVPEDEEEKKEEKKEDTKPVECNCPNDKKPTETNNIIKAETHMGKTLYQTDNGFYLSIDGDSDGKEYVIGDKYVKAYKVDFTTNAGIDIIEFLSYGNGGGGMFVFLEPKGENKKSSKLYYIDTYYSEIKDNIKPESNDKLNSITYVYSEHYFGASDAYAVTESGQKLNLYDFVKKD